MKYIIIMLCLCSSIFAANFDYVVSNEYRNETMMLLNESLLVENGGVSVIKAYGNETYVKVTSTTSYSYQEGGIGGINIFDSKVDIDSGDVGNIITERSSTLIYNAGNLDWIHVKDSSTVNFHDVNFTNAHVYDNSSFHMSGGHADYMFILDNSSVTLSGGNIDTIRNTQFVSLSEDISFNIICKDWSWNDETNMLSGHWEDDSTFNIKLTDTEWEDDTPYVLFDQIDFTIVPEPTSLTFAAIGGLILKKRYKK